MTAFIVGVAGGSGSGKTTVARAIADALQPESVALIDMDAYYHNFADRPFSEREVINWDHPDSIDWALFASQLAGLRAGRAIDKPVYDFTTHTRSPAATRVGPARVVIVDGILLFVDPAVRALCDLKIFVDADDDTRFLRRVGRDMLDRGRSRESVLSQYMTTVRPMYDRYVAPARAHADLVVRGDRIDDTLIRDLVATIRRRTSLMPVSE